VAAQSTTALQWCPKKGREFKHRLYEYLFSTRSFHNYVCIYLYKDVITNLFLIKVFELPQSIKFIIFLQLSFSFSLMFSEVVYNAFFFLRYSFRVEFLLFPYFSLLSVSSLVWYRDNNIATFMWYSLRYTFWTKQGEKMLTYTEFIYVNWYFDAGLL
jgi:hypothetical protein